MKPLTRRVAQLEGMPQAVPAPAELDRTRVTPEQWAWMEKFNAWLRQTDDARADYSKASVEQLQMLEWLWVRCDPNQPSSDHTPGCGCHYCAELNGGVLPLLPGREPSEPHL